MGKFKTNDKVVVNWEEEQLVLEYSKFSCNREYTILQTNCEHNMELCMIENDIGEIKKVNEYYLSFSPSYIRNEVIDDILN